MKIFLCNPPTGFFIRDERCQIDVNSRVAENIREPIQALYLTGLLQKYGYEVFLRDYSFSAFTIDHVLSDVTRFRPDCFYMETTQGTFRNDMSFIQSLYAAADGLFFIIKAPFLDFRYLEKEVKAIDLNIDTKIYFVVRNFEQTIRDILSPQGRTARINNTYLLLKQKIAQPISFDTDTKFSMDDYSLPPRYFLNKNDYLRPDTNEPMAYIYSSRGCPYRCIFCSAPIYLGRKIQTRSVSSVLAEIQECIEKYRISNFFFRSETFTFDKKWVMLFCKKIIEEKIKIRWGANGRVDRIDIDMLGAMKSAGCDIIGFGIESGSDEILKKIKKDICTSNIEHTNKITKETGIKTFFHCIVGFPWDNRETIAETKRLLLRVNPDFIEVNVPYPLRGTELYEIADKHNLFVSKSFRDFSHINPILRTFSLEAEEVSRLRKDLLFSFYCRGDYILNKLKDIKHPKVFFNYAKWGCRLIKKIFIYNLCV